MSLFLPVLATLGSAFAVDSGDFPTAPPARDRFVAEPTPEEMRGDRLGAIRFLGGRRALARILYLLEKDVAPYRGWALWDLPPEVRRADGRPAVWDLWESPLAQWKQSLPSSDSWSDIDLFYSYTHRCIFLQRKGEKRLFFRSPGWDDQGLPDPGPHKDVVAHHVYAMGIWSLFLSYLDTAEGLLPVYSQNLMETPLEHEISQYRLAPQHFDLVWLEGKLKKVLEAYGRRHGIRVLDLRAERAATGFGTQARAVKEALASGIDPTRAPTEILP
jgi:hypothetical protein